jgi:hypothetical protein
MKPALRKAYQMLSAGGGGGGTEMELNQTSWSSMGDVVLGEQ